MAGDDLLETLFAGELRELMAISYIVLGNNAVTNRFIERRFKMPVQAWSALYATKLFPGIRAKEIRLLFPRPQNTISRAVALLERRGYLVQQQCIGALQFLVTQEQSFDALGDQF